MSKIILIIDDEEDMQIYLEAILQKAGYETEIAVNGEEALKKLEQLEPDLITLDILMPKKSGLNFFQLLRKNKKSKKIPVIVVSGVTSHSEFFKDEANLGPTRYIEKPIVPDSFLHQVKSLLGET